MERSGANGGDERWSGAERGSSRIGMRGRGTGIPFANAAVRGTGACSGTGNRTCSEACGERSRCEAGSGIGMHLGTRQVRDENTSRAERIYSLFFFRPLSSVSCSPSLVFPLPSPFPYSLFSRSDLSPSSPSPFDSTPPPPPSSLSFPPFPLFPSMSLCPFFFLFLLPFSPPLVLFFSFPSFPPSSLVLFLLSSSLLFFPAPLFSPPSYESRKARGCAGKRDIVPRHSGCIVDQKTPGRNPAPPGSDSSASSAASAASPSSTASASTPRASSSPDAPSPEPNGRVTPNV